MGENRQIIDTWFRRVWGENDIAYIHEGCDASMATQGHREKGLLGPDEFVEFHQMICNHVDDISIKVTRSVEEGDWASAMYDFKAKKKGTDIPVEMTGNTMFRVKNGKFIEVYEHVDYIKFFSCLGTMPENTLENCLCGNPMQKETAG